jgi:hypothetical protein
MERFILQVILFLMFLTFYSYMITAPKATAQPVCTESIYIAQAKPNTISGLIREQVQATQPATKVSTAYLASKPLCTPKRGKGKQSISGLIREVNSATLAPIFE